MTSEVQKPHRPRSFVRHGRKTAAQERARTTLWSSLGLELTAGRLNYQTTFGREAPCFMEIGFGSGQSLLAIATARPDIDFIGVETHKPGIGALFMGIEAENLTNLRVYDADAVEVLEQCIPDASLDGAQLFFPDPWPKRRHHDRRLVQPEFVKLLISKIKIGGIFYLATDWEDYALHMMRVLSQEPQLLNMAGKGQYAERSPHRPVLTKFEQRAIKEGRAIWDLQFSIDNHDVLT